MNVLRSLARELVNLQVNVASAARDVGSLQPVREQRVAPVVGLSRFRDAFDQLPQGPRGTMQALRAEHAAGQGPARLAQALRALKTDGFEQARRAPVRLG